VRILAVDDDQILLELLVETLSVLGHQDVTTASSAQEALRVIAGASVPFDCFLLDIQMPEMDGIELCSIIRSMETYKASPVVMITAMSERSFIDRAFSAGAIDYVTKPFDGLELGTRLRLAQRIVTERKVSADKIFALNSLKAKVEDAFRIEADKPITIEDVPGVVDHLVLENYLLQLSRGKSYLSSAVAFHIRNFDAIYARATAEDLYYTLTDVAEAIATQFKYTSFLMTYMGNGVYVVVTNRNNPVINPDLEVAAQMAIDEMELCYDDGSACNVSLRMGEPQTNSLFFGGGPMCMVEAAVESARKGGFAITSDNRQKSVALRAPRQQHAS
jgi:CheY-like chemotaxis protein